MKTEANISVALCRQGERWKWIVTCERCGVDLSEDYSRYPVSLLRVPGLHEMLAQSPELAEEFIGKLQERWNEASQKGRPLVVDSEIDIVEAASCDLQRVIIEHVDLCSEEGS